MPKVELSQNTIYRLKQLLGEIRVLDKKIMDGIPNKIRTKDDVFNEYYPNGVQGLKKYDTAVPITLMDDIVDKVGKHANQHRLRYVYGYGINEQNHRIEGLIPITEQAELILQTYNHIVGVSVQFPTLNL